MQDFRNKITVIKVDFADRGAAMFRIVARVFAGAGG